MNSHTQVIAQTFMLALSFGTQLFGPVVNTRLTGVGFYKLGISIVLASLVFAFGLDFFMQPGLTNLEFGCYAILIVTNVVGYIAHRDEKTWPMWLLYTVQVMVFILLIFISQHGQNEFNPSRVQFFFMTALLLGISNYAMILGHYYLVVPKLSEEPLIYTLYIFWISLFIKLTFSLTTLVWMAPTY